MAVAEFVGLLAVVAVIMWWYKVGVMGYYCFPRCSSAADLLCTI